MLEDEPDKKLEALQRHLNEVTAGIELIIQTPNAVATLEDIQAERESRQHTQDLQVLKNRLIDLINDRQRFLKEREKACLKEVARLRVQKAQIDLEAICNEMSKLVSRHKELMETALGISKSMEVDFNTAYPNPRNLPLMVSVDPAYLRGFAPKTTVLYQSQDRPHQFYVKLENLNA